MKEKIKQWFSRRWVRYTTLVLVLCTLGAGIGWGTYELSKNIPIENFQSFETNDSTTNNIPYHSFVLVQHNIAVIPTACIITSIEGCQLPEADVIRARGSGVVVGHGTGMSHIMTAAHVCRHQPAPGVLIHGVPYEYRYMESINIVDFYGVSHEGLVVGADEENDLCLVSVEGIWSESVPIADNIPDLGEPVQNMAAPMGIFSAGMVLMFDGRYSGTDRQGDAFFTVPSYAGSSGSAILNSSGEVVGIIHSATRDFDNISIATTRDPIVEFLAEHAHLFQ